MTEREQELGRWQGQVETVQKNHGMRLKRLEALVWTIISGFAAVGAQAMGVLPW